MNADITLWPEALADLELQMTQATFDAWLRGTRCVGVDGDTLIVEVKNTYAIEWLESRLNPMITRTLHRLTGNGTTARYVVAGDDPANAAPADVADTLSTTDTAGDARDMAIASLVEVLRSVVDPQARKALQQQIAVLGGQYAPVEEAAPLDFDTYGAGGGGYYPVSNYADQFWKPLLASRKAFLVYTSLRSLYKSGTGDWTPLKHVSIKALCERVPCSRNTILGEAREGEHRPGALDLLREAGVARVEVYGEGRHTTHHVSVRVKLPLLTAAQVAQLQDDVQAQHAAWLEAHGVA